MSNKLHIIGGGSTAKEMSETAKAIGYEIVDFLEEESSFDLNNTNLNKNIEQLNFRNNFIYGIADVQIKNEKF